MIGSPTADQPRITKTPIRESLAPVSAKVVLGHVEDPCRAIRLPQCAGFLSLCAGAGRARSKAHPSSNGFGCAAIFNALTVPPQAGFRICAKSLLGIDPANCRVASSDPLALAHGSLALRVSANLSDHSLATAVLALLTRSCPSRRLRRTAEMGGERAYGVWSTGHRSASTLRSVA
jgi:hypothetical protein